MRSLVVQILFKIHTVIKIKHPNAAKKFTVQKTKLLHGTVNCSKARISHTVCGLTEQWIRNIVEIN